MSRRGRGGPDFRKFLGQRETLVLPYLGGATVSTRGRRLRLTSRPAAPGYHRFQVEGRRATPSDDGEPIERPDLDERPKQRGHYAGRWLFVSGERAERLHLLPEAEPEPLCLMGARRWHGGELLFDAMEFETEAEMEARLRLEEGAPLGGLKGVAPSLRHAYGFALVAAASRRTGTPVTVLEVGAAAGSVADGGAPEAEAFLARLGEERARYARERTHRDPDALRLAGQRERIEARRRDPEAAAIASLANAGAELLSTRAMGAGELEVAFRFRGQRFVCLVDAQTLHVYDAGLCLDGHDEQLALDSLPSVIREAIETGQLVVTRH